MTPAASHTTHSPEPATLRVLRRLCDTPDQVPFRMLLREGGTQHRLTEADLQRLELPGSLREVRDALHKSLRSLTTTLKLLVIDIELNADGERELRIGPAGHCGFGSCSVGGRDFYVEVRPKIENVHYLALLQRASRLPPLTLPETKLDTTDPQALPLLIAAAYEHALRTLLTGPMGNLRRLHVRRTNELRARMRGQLLVPAYLRNIARGKLLEVPCRYQAHMRDNLPNRTLLWALQLARGLVSSGCQDAIREGLTALEPRFQGVRLTQIRPEQLHGLARLPHCFDAYLDSHALPLARWLIQHARLGNVQGEVPSIGFSFDMAKVFEDAFAAEVKRCFQPRGRFAQQHWHFQLKEQGLEGVPDRSTKTGTFKPDVYLAPEAGQHHLVMDTKWKSALSQAQAVALDYEDEIAIRVQGIKIVNADIFQVISYAHLARLRERTRTETAPGQDAPRDAYSALIYPVCGTNGEILRLHWQQIESDHGRLRVYLIPWRVDAEIEEGTKVLMQRLQRLRAGHLPE